MLHHELISSSEETYQLVTDGSDERTVIQTNKIQSVATEKFLKEADGIQLDRKMTDYVGFSMSTYQNKSDPTFASQSNWGELEKILFTDEKKNLHLSSGGGVDILSEKGRVAICDAILQANGNVIRFSVEWADVEREPGVYSEEAIDRYIDAAKYINSRGLTPVVTLHHFVEPLWFSKVGAFEYADNIKYFVRFSTYVYDKMAECVDYYVTFNEPTVYATEGYILGDFPPNRRCRFMAHTTVLNHLLQSHLQVYDAIHQLSEKKKKTVHVGLTHQALRFIPTSKWNLISVAICSVMNYRFHGLFMNLVGGQADKFDFFGVQYYSRPLIGGFPPDSICGNGEKMVESMHFRFDPSGIKEMLQDVASRIPKVPLWVTETGTAGDSAQEDMGERRAEYYTKSLKAVAEAQSEGVNVRAYLAWTLYGNFEWAHGYSRNHDFGVIHRHKFDLVCHTTPGYEVIQKIFSRTLRG
jgi:beta-glucosidase